MDTLEIIIIFEFANENNYSEKTIQWVIISILPLAFF